MRKILVAIMCRGPHSQEISVELLETIMQLEKPEGYEVEVSTSYRMPVDSNRNFVFKKVLETPDIEYILMLDADISPPKNILEMIKHNEKIISGMIMIMKKGIPQPCAMKLVENTLTPVILSDFQKRADSLIEVDGIGTGCLMVHRSVIEQIQPPWFKFEYDSYGIMSVGEDYHFSLKARANNFRIFVDSSMPCGHLKTLNLLDINRLLYDAISGKYKLKDKWSKDGN